MKKQLLFIAAFLMLLTACQDKQKSTGLASNEVTKTEINERKIKPVVITDSCETPTMLGQYMQTSGYGSSNVYWSYSYDNLYATWKFNYTLAGDTTEYSIIYTNDPLLPSGTTGYSVKYNGQGYYSWIWFNWVPAGSTVTIQAQCSSGWSNRSASYIIKAYN